MSSKLICPCETHDSVPRAQRLTHLCLHLRHNGKVVKRETSETKQESFSVVSRVVRHVLHKHYFADLAVRAPLAFITAGVLCGTLRCDVPGSCLACPPFGTKGLLFPSSFLQPSYQHSLCYQFALSPSSTCTFRIIFVAIRGVYDC